MEVIQSRPPIFCTLIDRAPFLLAIGPRRLQSSGFFLRPGKGLADESEQMAIDASRRVAEGARAYAELQSPW